MSNEDIRFLVALRESIGLLISSGYIAVPMNGKDSIS